MSQLEQGFFPDRYPRHDNPAAPSTGITESLAVPGLAVTPPVVGNDAQQFFAAIDAASNFFGVAGSQARRDQIEAERQLAELGALDEQMRKKVEAQNRGAAVLHAEEILPSIESDIINGRLTGVLDDPTGFIDRFVGERTKGNAAPEFVARFREIATPRLANAINTRRDALFEQATAAVLDTSRVDVLASNSPEEVLKARDLARATVPGKSDLQVDGIVLLPALKAAAERGDRKLYSNISAVLGDRFVPEQIALQDVLTTNESQVKKKGQDAAIGSIRAAQLKGLPLEQLVGAVDALDGGVLDPEQAVSLRRELLAGAQRSTRRALEGRILAGAISREEVQKEVIAASGLSESNPAYIDPGEGRQLLNLFGDVEKTKLADTQVRAALSGQRVVLTEGQHGASFAKALGPEGSGLIDAANTITNPKALGGALLVGRLVPKQTADTIVANLGLGDPNAAEVAGMVGAASPSMFESLRDAATEQQRAGLDAAREAYQRGLFDTPAGRAKAMQSIDAALKRPPVEAKPAPEVLGEINAAGVKLDDELATAFGTIRELKTYTKDTRWGFDFLNPDPDLNPSGSAVASRYADWFTKRWAELPETVSTEKRTEIAREYAKTKLADSTDLVRWGGLIRPALIDDGSGVRLADGYRWGEGFEEEARAELTAMGVDPATVETVAPFLSPRTSGTDDPAKATGWQFITSAGVQLVNGRGELVVWRPSDQAQKAAAKQRAILDDAAIRFGSHKTFREKAADILYDMGGPDIGRKR